MKETVFDRIIQNSTFKIQNFLKKVSFITPGAIFLDITEKKYSFSLFQRLKEGAMRTRSVFSAIVILLFSLTLLSCDIFDGGGSGGDDPSPPSSLMAEKTYISSGPECEYGGIRIDMGFDNNGNNVLDADEITNTEYVCNGANGEDSNSHLCCLHEPHSQ